MIPHRPHPLLLLILTGQALMARPAAAQTIAYEEAPHHYWSTPLTDPGTTLDAELQSGKFTLPAGSDPEAMRAVLRQMKIPESSQTLVFSKTSVQKDRITPWNPRALYFNDESYAGWVPGGQQMLVAREARGQGRYRKSFEVVRLDGLTTERVTGDVAALPLFQRWQDPAWKRETLSLR